ncbi:Ltp family lipoprotein [Enterococcus faecalis]|uniref:Ltp family lipoprotein n=1 Tax=Enterococcus faecalis TaxID=1351 RepID=UPI0015728BC5|nr:Ltp family lipoprotein [Enterococcus faecalis]EHU8827511.1 Ltp family lipoprotein [Enterococcus faecalis]ELT6641322.1 Ltp family lipoprotein [Enterococcus faecalis]MBJ0372657.1 Ltp family lipoprotein [Enterococcus faecalis]NST37245.1 Ltp family lipoprotein [Enterococcus faecalis]HCY8998349.1 Ltp family lipoprotein [Enterococcus faecalis]
MKKLLQNKQNLITLGIIVAIVVGTILFFSFKGVSNSSPSTSSSSSQDSSSSYDNGADEAFSRVAEDIDKRSSIIKPNFTSESSDEKVVQNSASSEVSREFQNALQSAKDYLDYTAFSKQGLYEQLLYEKYPEDAAQYAIDNIQVDWNKNALQTAKDYLDYSSFSNQGLYEQLIHDGYTEEQAQFAVDNLPK